jgi:hypothetical protein
MLVWGGADIGFLPFPAHLLASTSGDESLEQDIPGVRSERDHGGREGH